MEASRLYWLGFVEENGRESSDRFAYIKEIERKRLIPGTDQK